MLLKLDANNYIQGYAIIGGLEGAIEVDLNEEDIPFPHYEAYQYIDGKIILDKIKLNEWILTYNDWVNDVNTSKEIYGWVSWYYSVDMSEHKIIELV